MADFNRIGWQISQEYSDGHVKGNGSTPQTAQTVTTDGSAVADEIETAEIPADAVGVKGRYDNRWGLVYVGNRSSFWCYDGMKFNYHWYGGGLSTSLRRLAIFEKTANGESGKRVGLIPRIQLSRAKTFVSALEGIAA